MCRLAVLVVAVVVIVGSLVVLAGYGPSPTDAAAVENPIITNAI